MSRRAFLEAGSTALCGLALACRPTRTRYPCPELRTGIDYDARPIPSDFDLIVVGSGFAGTFLGLRAVENRMSTLILEAGGDVSAPGDGDGAFGFENVGEVRYPVATTRAIGVGGTSSRWGGVVSRPFPDDFRMRSKYGLLMDWPLSYEEIEPYLCESESLLRVRGAPPASGEPPRTCEYPTLVGGDSPRIPLDENVPDYVPVARSRETSGDALRLSRNVIPRFESSRYAKLARREQVIRLVTIDGRRIDHVESYREDGTVGRYGARHFVVAAGAIETPRLLLASRSVHHPDGIGNDEGLLGRHLSVHPSIEMSFVVDDLRGEVGEGEYRAFEPIETMRTRGLNGYHVHLLTSGDGKVTWRVQPEMEARWENRVRLLDDDDACGPAGNRLPAIELSFSDQDRRTIEEIRDLLRRTQSSLAARADSVREWDRWRAHPSGTCRMGPDAKTGVVDRDNRVFGLENLYLSGSSTFTTAGTANPTNLIVALTLRLADRLVARQARLSRLASRRSLH